MIKSSMEELDVEKANRVAWRVARNVAERYPTSTAEDLSQEVWGWIVSHQEEILGWEDEWWVRNLYRRGYRLANSFARKERAQFLGYEPQDEFFYSVPMLRRMLPLYLQEGLEPELSFHDRVVKLDLDVVFECLDVESALLLKHVFEGDDVPGATQAYALAAELTEEAASSRIDRILGRAIDILGGPNPHPVTSRQVLSNEQAQALTRRQG